MSHGYYFKRNGEVVLGFADSAPNFNGEKPKVLVPAQEGDEVLAYSVVKEGEDRGFLWHADEKGIAELEATSFSAMFGRRYTCVGLTHDKREPVDQ